MSKVKEKIVFSSISKFRELKIVIARLLCLWLNCSSKCLHPRRPMIRRGNCSIFSLLIKYFFINIKYSHQLLYTYNDFFLLKPNLKNKRIIQHLSAKLDILVRSFFLFFNFVVLKVLQSLSKFFAIFFNFH